MKKPEILNRLECPVFISNTRNLQPVKALYPFSLEHKLVVKKELKKSGQTLTFILPEEKKDRKEISFVLYVLNHFGAGTYLLRRNDYFETVEKDADGIVSAEVLFDENEIPETASEIMGSELLENYKKDDVVLVLSREEKQKKIVLSSAAVICAAVIVLAGAYKVNESLLTRRALDVKNEKVQAEQLEQNRKKNEELARLKTEYEKLMAQKAPEVYDSLVNIFNCLGKNIKVENLSIENSSFSVDVITKDAVRILGKFEGSSGIQNVQMNRTTIQNGQEYVSYNGKLQHFIVYPDEKNSVEEKIEFYKNASGQEKVANTETVSGYAGRIRSLLKKYGLKEDYLQSRIKDGKVVLETLINGKSESIFSFIKRACVPNEKLNISSTRIKNNQDYSAVQCVLLFDTGIDFDEGTDLSEGLSAEGDVSVQEIGNAFYKVPSKQVQSTATAFAKPAAEKPVQQLLAVDRNLEYVGEARNGNGELLVFIKNKVYGNLYKLPLVEELTSSNCCRVLESGNYEAVINSKHYEVKK